MLDNGECAEAVIFQLENAVGVIEWKTPLLERHWLELSWHLCIQNSKEEAVAVIWSSFTLPGNNPLCSDGERSQHHVAFAPEIPACHDLSD